MQKVLVCIQTGTTVDDPSPMAFATEEFYLKSEEEMRALFPAVPEAFDNTVRIAERCPGGAGIRQAEAPHLRRPRRGQHRLLRAALHRGDAPAVWGIPVP